MGEFALGLVTGLLASFLLFSMPIHSLGMDEVWRKAVERGYAEYCPKTDNFAWKGECE